MANCWTVNRELVRQALAASSAFQGLVGATDDATAARHIFGVRVEHPDRRPYTLEEMETLRHYAQVYSAAEAPYGKRRRAHGGFEPHGTVTVLIMRLIPDAQWNDAELGGDSDLVSPAASRLVEEFEELVGDVIDQVLQWLDEHGGPYVQTCDVTEGPGFSARDRVAGTGTWQGVELTLRWDRTEQVG